LAAEADLLLPDGSLRLGLGRHRLCGLLRPDGLRFGGLLRLPAEADLLLPDRGLVALAHVSFPPGGVRRSWRWTPAACRLSRRSARAGRPAGRNSSSSRGRRLSRPFRAGRDRTAPAPLSASREWCRSASP